MQDFTYKIIDDGTFAVMSYAGDEAEVTVPRLSEKQPVTLIADCIFRGHGEIRSISLPETLSELGGFVFDGCVRLRKVELPDGLRAMWQYAFVRSGIETIDVPGTVASIVSFTFKDCVNLREAILHRETKKIHAWAFQGCTALRTVTVPPDAEIHPLAFEGCSPDLRILRDSR